MSEPSNFVKQINITSSFGLGNKQDQSNQFNDNSNDEMEYEPINISSAKNRCPWNKDFALPSPLGT